MEAQIESTVGMVLGFWKINAFGPIAQGPTSHVWIKWIVKMCYTFILLMCLKFSYVILELCENIFLERYVIFFHVI
jgi:hypothetical protein